MSPRKSYQPGHKFRMTCVECSRGYLEKYKPGEGSRGYCDECFAKITEELKKLRALPVGISYPMATRCKPGAKYARNRGGEGYTPTTYRVSQRHR